MSRWLHAAMEPPMSTPVTLRALPRAGLPSGVSSNTVGLLYSSASREATMPTMPACQAGWASTRPLKSRYWGLRSIISMAAAVVWLVSRRRWPLSSSIVGGQLAGTYGIIGGQQLDRDRGILQPPQRVHARADLKADGLAVDLARRHPCHFHQRQQPDATGVAQLVEPPLQQIAGVVDLLGHVGHNAQGHQIEQLLFAAAATGQRVEFLHQLVGDAHAGQGAQRIVVGLELGIDDGVGAADAVLAGALLGPAPRSDRPAASMIEIPVPDRGDR